MHVCMYVCFYRAVVVVLVSVLAACLTTQLTLPVSLLLSMMLLVAVSCSGAVVRQTVSGNNDVIVCGYSVRDMGAVAIRW